MNSPSGPSSCWRKTAVNSLSGPIVVLAEGGGEQPKRPVVVLAEDGGDQPKSADVTRSTPESELLIRSSLMKKHILVGTSLLLTLGTAVAGTLMYGQRLERRRPIRTRRPPASRRSGRRWRPSRCGRRPRARPTTSHRKRRSDRDSTRDRAPMPGCAACLSVGRSLSAATDNPANCALNHRRPRLMLGRITLRSLTYLRGV